MMESLFQTYQLQEVLDMLQADRCSITYIEKSIKCRGSDVIRDKIAMGFTHISSEDRKELIRRWVGKDIDIPFQILERRLQEMEQQGYRRKERLVHLGKECRDEIWRSEVYVHQTHVENTRYMGTSMDLTTNEYSHYEVFIETWLEALMRLRPFFSNVEYNHLSYVLGHMADTTHKHICKIDSRYLYSMYFSVFLPYEEVKNDLYPLFTTFTGKNFQEYEHDFEEFPILAMIHVSQEIDGPRQFSLYFRPKDT